MTAVAPLRPVDLARDLQELATLVSSEHAVDDVLRRGLDWLARVAPYDLATVFVLEQGRLVVRAARGPLADDRVRQHALALEQFPSLREALETRRARTFLEQDHRHGDGDPFDHVLDLPPGHACLVAPLVAGDQSLGVLTLDRTVCEVYPPPVVNLVEVYAQLLAIAMQGAGKTVTLERLHQQDHAHAKLMEEQLGGAPELDAQIRSAEMQALLRRARQVARAQTPVLIRGEPGSGKERLARAIHAWSERAEHPFVSLSCAAVPDGALELELFGHVEGAFAGVGRARPGRLVVANGGTLFLDEVSELPLPLQTRLLRVLQDGEFEPVGSDRPVRVDVRVLAATHADLEAAVAAGRFREDLFYLLDVFPLETAAAARAPRRRGSARRSAARGAGPAHRKDGAAAHSRGGGAARGARLARERARAGQRAGARPHPRPRGGARPRGHRPARPEATGGPAARRRALDARRCHPAARGPRPPGDAGAHLRPGRRRGDPRAQAVDAAEQDEERLPAACRR